jgi:cell division protein FtsL
MIFYIIYAVIMFLVLLSLTRVIYAHIQMIRTNKKMMELMDKINKDQVSLLQASFIIDKDDKNK